MWRVDCCIDYIAVFNFLHSQAPPYLVELSQPNQSQVSYQGIVSDPPLDSSWSYHCCCCVLRRLT